MQSPDDTMDPIPKPSSSETFGAVCGENDAIWAGNKFISDSQTA
jgi:hypothetical protein